MRAGTLGVVFGLAAILLSAGGAMAVSIDTVPVGNPNLADIATGYGAVSYDYNIGKYEVTAGQYAAFLNAVAKSDTYGLYNASMADTSFGSGITRSGLSGDFVYAVAAAFETRPVNYVSWGDAARFANWLHNGQPIGAQGPTTTEDGAYFLDGAITVAALMAVTRELDWKWAITSEDEWYKAAYYNPSTASYYKYPTSSNANPINAVTDPDGGNNANYNRQSSYTTAGGEFELSGSPYGTFDQGGNVSEWNEAMVLNTAGALAYRGLRGGSYYDTTSLNLQSTRRSRWAPTGEDSVWGFRVTELPVVTVIPEPLTLVASISGLAGLAGYLRRRRLA